MSVLGDLYALTNSLSQYQYIDEKTSAFGMPKTLANDLLEAALHDAELPAKRDQEHARKDSVNIDNNAVKIEERAPNCLKFMRRNGSILEK